MSSISKRVQLFLSSFALFLTAAYAAAPSEWPSLEKQLALDNVPRGSALERFIADNQEFELLRLEEASDLIGIPPWLRVSWRKENPDGVFPADDPTGGYPRVLKDIYAFMVANPSFRTSDEQILVPPPPPGITVGTNLRISGAQTTSRSESSIQIDFLNPNRIIAASNRIVSGGTQAQFYSSDGGLTWGQTTLPLTSNDRLHSDPTVDWTSDGTGWATTLGITASNRLRVRSYRSLNGGATWSFEGTVSGSQTSTDKQMQWIDHSPTSPFRNNNYVTWHNGAPAYVNRRTGGVWQTPIQVSGSESTGTAIGGDIKTNSAGDVFAFWPATGNRRVVVKKSTNGGASFGSAVIITTTYDSYDIGVPSFASRRALIYTTGGAYRTATKDLVYAAWTDLTGATGCSSAANEPGTNVSSTCKTRIWFSRSTNGGANWSAPVMINNQASLNDQYNPWLAVDETSGRIAITYYDTVGDAGRKKTDIWYQSSGDDGLTFSAPFRVTTAMTDETVSGADLGNQYGDYNGLSGSAGVFFPSWTDRRNGGKEEIWTAQILDP